MTRKAQALKAVVAWQDWTIHASQEHKRSTIAEIMISNDNLTEAILDMILILIKER